ncbi:MAG: radical SAM protein, partial [Planctomycetota bacterium]
MAVLFPSPPVSGIAMLVELQPPLGPLTDWIRAADQHASHHLPLLVRAQRILGGQEKAGDAERQELADRLERWRYQHLDSHRDSPSPLGQRLAEVLDLASNELCGRNRRAPRCPRAAVSDTYRQPQEVVRGLTCLDPQVSLETVEQRAAELTRMRFRVPSSPRSASADRASEERVVTRPDADRSIRIGGTSISARRMLLYAPLYLSSHCINYCVYCGFRYPNEIERRHLNFDQAMEQAGKLARHGFRHLLLVAGDFPSLTSVSYFAGIVGALSEEGFSVAVEVAPMTASGYAALAAAGAVGVTLYQETYNEILYALYHPHGTKTS